MQNTLAEKILSLKRPGQNYDCILLFSGGKDSSYLLYHLSHELNLKVLAVTVTHDFIPPETRKNIENFSKSFSAKHLFVENTTLNKSGKHFLETWINKPDEGSLITLCTGCRLGLIKPIIEIAKAENVSTVVTGITPFEATTYRINLVNYPKGKKGGIYFFIGYLRLLIRNPSLLKDIKAFISQAEELYYFKNRDNLYEKNNLTLLKPYYDYIKYDEYDIIKTINKLGWIKPVSSTSNSYWRSDCNMYAIRHYFYNQVAGYNEQKEYYGKMFENKLISKEYLDESISRHYDKQEIMDILTNLELSESSLDKYKDFVGKFANSDIAYPSCSGCKGLGSYSA